MTFAKKVGIELWRKKGGQVLVNNGKRQLSEELANNPNFGWKPGQSGNPAGRPPIRKTIDGWIRAIAGRIVPDTDQSYAEVAAMAVWTGAMNGDHKMAKLAFDRIEPAVTVVADITDRLSRDEQLEQIAVNTRSTLDRWACALPGS